MDSSVIPFDIPFDNSYAQLPPRFFSHQLPEPVAKPASIRVNQALAESLGIAPAWLESAEGIATVAGNHIPAGAQPIATVYAGHQFGGWNPQLGDGRAVLLGEVVDCNGMRHDIQLKGSGRTPYSRGGDGRAPLGPVLREYIVSEAMSALAIPTTRALAAVTTGEPVYREQSLPGAVLARVAQSHIRIGTFQYFASRGDTEALQILADHVIARHFPQAAGADNPYLHLLQEAVSRQAQLVARWQLVGFIHGVMNTDNILLSGETIDYGPCAFMDAFDPDQVYSSIDHQGRYAYRKQPGIAHWNLACLAQTLIPLIDTDEDKAVAAAQQVMDSFPDSFMDAHLRGMGSKLGLQLEGEDDERLVQDLLSLMHEEGADFTLSFRRLTDLAAGADTLAGLFEFSPDFEPWLRRWRTRCASELTPAEVRHATMAAANPVYIARNHLVQEVITAATEDNNFKPFHTLVDLLADPFKYDPAMARYAIGQRPEQVVGQTFCGT
jgi:uncharacterized protein YdiU (UPF0061 family)